MQRLTRLLGISKAKDLIFTGRTLTAVEAQELGRVHDSTPV
jgi:methylglutaconyl-CoA hydratase